MHGKFEWKQSHSIAFWSLVTHPPSLMPATTKLHSGWYAGDNFTYEWIRWRICWFIWVFSFIVWIVISLIHVCPKVGTIFFVLVLSSPYLVSCAFQTSVNELTGQIWGSHCGDHGHCRIQTDRVGACQKCENFVCPLWFLTRIPWFWMARPLKIDYEKCLLVFLTVEWVNWFSLNFPDGVLLGNGSSSVSVMIGLWT
jgi:hypothetical protein